MTPIATVISTELICVITLFLAYILKHLLWCFLMIYHTITFSHHVILWHFTLTSFMAFFNGPAFEKLCCKCTEHFKINFSRCYYSCDTVSSSGIFLKVHICFVTWMHSNTIITHFHRDNTRLFMAHTCIQLNKNILSQRIHWDTHSPWTHTYVHLSNSHKNPPQTELAQVKRESLLLSHLHNVCVLSSR